MRLCLTGGGTAGHVTPHFALLPGIRARGWDVFYIGGKGLEKSLVESQGIPFRSVATGKLRRYVSVQNALDVFKVFAGFVQAFWILLGNRPDAVFSKGGFVAVPIAWAAWCLRIPVVSHESDLTPGLANKLIAPIARTVLYTFPETAKYLGTKGQHAGTPVRAELLLGDARRGAALCGFDPAEKLPTYLVMGGSQGAQRINDALLALLPDLLKRARVIHLTGQGKALDFKHPRYKGFEFVRDELKDLYALADGIISRSGANSIFEFLALRKPMLLIPLELGSRGDQIANAESFAKNGWALTLRETGLTAASLGDAVVRLDAASPAMREKQAAFSAAGAAETILGILERVAAR